jgi:hypothetical protein
MSLSRAGSSHHQTITPTLDVPASEGRGASSAKNWFNMISDVALEQDGRPTFAFDTDMVVHKGTHELRDGLSFPGFRTLSGRVRAKADLCKETGSLPPGLIGREILWRPQDHFREGARRPPAPGRYSMIQDSAPDGYTLRRNPVRSVS